MTAEEGRRGKRREEGERREEEQVDNAPYASPF
jgi:hypothetical protein